MGWIRCLPGEQVAPFPGIPPLQDTEKAPNDQPFNGPGAPSFGGQRLGRGLREMQVSNELRYALPVVEHNGTQWLSNQPSLSL
jgi:hypothetical protein